jgi:hypothetical protein
MFQKFYFLSKKGSQRPKPTISAKNDCAAHQHFPTFPLLQENLGFHWFSLKNKLFFLQLHLRNLE